MFEITGRSASNLELLQALMQGRQDQVAPGTSPAAEMLYRAVQRDGRLRPWDAVRKDILLQQAPAGEGVAFLPMDRLISPEEKGVIQEAMHTVVESGMFTSGPFVAELEAELSCFTGIANALSACSGTEAMLFGLLALGVGQGDEVVIPANSFAATENAVLLIGAMPVLADVGPDYTLAPEALAAVVTPRTRAVIPVHLYGKLADMQNIRRVADANGIKVLEDACQSIGASGLGRNAHMAALSFNPFKNFSVCGKGGALLVHDDSLAHQCRAWAYHGFDPRRKNIKAAPYGLNARLDNIQAAVAMARLPWLGLRNFKRLCLAWRYDAKLQPLADAGLLLKTPLSHDHVWHHYSIELAERSRLEVQHALREGFAVETDVYYPVLTHRYETPLHKRLYNGVCLPRTEAAGDCILQLPLYPDLSLEEQDRVLAALENILTAP